MPKHPFVVGNRYSDRCGGYQVLAITGGHVKIRYDDGREATADIAIKARIHANIAADDHARHPHQSAAYFRTLGFLTRHGNFQAEVPPKARATFENKYHEITGHRPVLGNGYFPIDAVTDDDKWGAELRINFPARADLEFPPTVELRSGANPGTLRINNNQYWWSLVQVGFRLNLRNEVEGVRATVPSAFRTAFDDGSHCRVGC